MGAGLSLNLRGSRIFQISRNVDFFSLGFVYTYFISSQILSFYLSRFREISTLGCWPRDSASLLSEFSLLSLSACMFSCLEQKLIFL